MYHIPAVRQEKKKNEKAYDYLSRHQLSDLRVPLRNAAHFPRHVHLRARCQRVRLVQRHLGHQAVKTYHIVGSSITRKERGRRVREKKCVTKKKTVTKKQVRYIQKKRLQKKCVTKKKTVTKQMRYKKNTVTKQMCVTKKNGYKTNALQKKNTVIW